MIIERFVGPDLDRSRWLPHYLPAWSSLRRSAAHVRCEDGLVLSIPQSMGLWCENEHPIPLRVSGLQSANRSGPKGSSDGQQRFRDELLVQESQEAFFGMLVCEGRVSITCRMELSDRSMAALWLSGLEDDPANAGELCVFEIFGRSVRSVGRGWTAEVGVGVKAKFDPRLSDSFVAPQCEIDVSELHAYEVEWGNGVVRFNVDGNLLHTVDMCPEYPLQIMLAVFDFPLWSNGSDAEAEPKLFVDCIQVEGEIDSRSTVAREQKALEREHER